MPSWTGFAVVVVIVVVVVVIVVVVVVVDRTGLGILRNVFKLI